MDSRGKAIDELVGMALEEDAAFDDITTGILVPVSAAGEARIVARAHGVISGQRCAEAVFKRIDPKTRYRIEADDASAVTPGQTVSSIRGHISSILSAERTALNFLCHLSGISTLTSMFVEKVRGTGVVILDTRKTLPGLRTLQKEAVVHGGGRNHRADLASYILAKENHIAAAGGIDELVSKLGDRLAAAEIEVASIEQLRELKTNRPARIMLDNFSPEDVEAAVGEMAGWDGEKPEVEISGGVTLDNVSSYAKGGVDFISVGALTSSAASLDLSLLVFEEDR